MKRYPGAVYYCGLQGGFPFSTRACGWIVADCTAEGLKAVMLLQESQALLLDNVHQERLQQAVDVVGAEDVMILILTEDVMIFVD